MTNLERYIISEVLKPLAAVVAILALLFACFSSARYLAEAVSETLGVTLMLKLVMLKTFISLEVLVPVSLYASVLIGLSRMHRDQEIVAMQAAGVESRRIIRSILIVAIPVGFIIGLLSLFGRPWAYEASYFLDAAANAELNTDRFQPGRFYGNEDSGRVVYVDDKNRETGELHSAFHFLVREQASEIILAKTAFRVWPSQQQRPQVHVNNGRLYKLDRASGKDQVVRFRKMVYFADATEPVGYKRKAAANSTLWSSSQSRDIAELQWRLSRPLATVLLALVAVPLSRSSPRQGKGERSFVAVLVFAIYYNLSGLAQTWVEQGHSGWIPGVWWLHAFMLLAVIFMLRADRGPRRAGRT